MKKDLIIRIIVMLVSLAVASYLAVQLTPMQNEITFEKKDLTKMPVAGLHKFLADVAWMRFVNYAGGLSSIDSSNVDKVGKMLQTIISYDPNFIESYQCGVLSIASANPKLAIKILEDACNNEYLKKYVQIPFYAGFLYSRQIVDPQDPKKVLLEPDYAAAVRWFREAIRRSNSSEAYIVSNYINAKTKLRGGEPTSAKLAVLYDEWRAANVDKNMAMTDEYCRIPNLEYRLLVAIKDAMYPYDPNDKPVKPSPAAMKLINKVMKEVFDKKHICHSCFYQINAGDKFCSNCGKKAKVWGTCICGTVLKPNASYCHKCGKQQ